MAPAGSYPAPLVVYRRDGSTRALTVIWLAVMVPVLSVQMMLVEPSVSTDSNRRTSAPR